MSGDGKSLVENARILQSLLEDLVQRTMSLKAQHEVSQKVSEDLDSLSRKRKSRLLLGSVEDLESRYHEICSSHKELSLKFNALQSTVRVAQSSNFISELLNDLKVMNNAGGSEGGKKKSPFSEELDPEEIKYVQELLDEQNELCKDVFRNQVEIFQSELSLSRSRGDLLRSFVSLKERGMLLISEDGQNGGPPADGSSKLNNLQESLQREEEKLHQLQIFVLTIVNLISSLGIEVDPESSLREKKLIIDSGRSIDELRAEAHS
eukprot:TRINITY_DN15048_c0_g1_i1.p1 TRINITY_DN15048_c0_g1~~TRINITY_DN15048_c0_g1_i1.p1  ORF type:complete len:264 (-),score=91.65 TRINITY_DN15048_c0_g1_i1:59-850(-)